MKTPLKNCFLCLFSLLVFWIGLEFAAGFVPIEEKTGGKDFIMDPYGNVLFSCVPDDLLGYRLKPGSKRGNVGINSLGFAGREFSKEKAEDAFRIICVGGSTTFGSGSKTEDYSFPALLERVFAAVSPKGAKRIEVINAGTPGYHTWHTELRLKELMALNPDMFILMDGFNDVLAAHVLKKDVFENLERNQVMGALTKPESSFLQPLAGLLSRSRLYQVVRQGLRRLEAPGSDLVDRLELFGTREKMRTVVSESLNKGIDVVLLNHPWIVHSADIHDLEKEVRRIMPGLYFFVDSSSFGAYIIGRKYISGLNQSLQKEYGVQLINLQGIFDKNTVHRRDIYSMFSNDTIHFTEYGNYLAAKYIYFVLMRDEKIQRASGRREAVSEADLDALFPDIKKTLRTDWGANWLDYDPYFANIAIDAKENILDNAEDGYEAWGFYSPKDPPYAGALHFRVEKKHLTDDNLLFVYPRINKKDSRIFVDLVENGVRTRIYDFASDKAEDRWTPIKSIQRIELPMVRSDVFFIDVTLVGRWAQLWHDAQGNALFFR